MVALFCAASALAQDGGVDPSTFDHKKDVRVLHRVIEVQFEIRASNLSGDPSIRSDGVKNLLQPYSQSWRAC